MPKACNDYRGPSISFCKSRRDDIPPFQGLHILLMFLLWALLKTIFYHIATQVHRLPHSYFYCEILCVLCGFVVQAFQFLSFQKCPYNNIIPSGLFFSEGKPLFGHPCYEVPDRYKLNFRHPSESYANLTGCEFIVN